MLDESGIDTLTGGEAEGGADGAPRERQIFSRHSRERSAAEIRPYDFRRPERVSKDQMRALHTLHESFARSLGASLSGFLRTIVEIRVSTCEQMTYGQFIGSLPNPTSFNLIQADALDGQMCLEISPLIIYPIIDRLLGGTNHDLFIPQRPMTPIEGRLISNVTSRGLIALSEAWESVRPLKFEVAAVESNPQLVQIVPPNEVVVVVALELKMGVRAGTMNLCIPYNVIEPLVDELAAQSWFSVHKTADADKYRQRVNRSVGRAPVGASAVLAETTITLGDLAGLQVGDVITTEKPATAPAVLRVEGVPKFLASIGRHKDSRAVRVLRAIKPEDRY